MKKILKWFKLDYSASFYPVLTTRTAQSIFRISAIMDDVVNPEMLLDALNEVIVRFPLYKVRQRAGIFWYYLEENTEPFNVFEDDGILLKKIDTKKTNGYLFRLCYFGKKISLDMFHGLTDGTGAMVFFRAIIFAYAKKCGKTPSAENVIDLLETPSSAEFEDSFARYAQKTKLKDIELNKFMGQRPLVVDGHKFVGEGYGSITGEISVTQLKELAKKYNCNVTHLVCAKLIKAIYDNDKKKKRPCVIMVPINFRKQFESITLKNFVLFTKIYVYPKNCDSLENIIGCVREQMAQAALKEEQQKQINTTVNGINTFVFKILPLPIKYFFIRLGRLFFKSKHSMIFSNLGVANMPEGAGLNKVFFNLNVSNNNPVNCGAISNGDTLMISFTRTIAETEVERRFFTSLTEEGVKVKIMSNFREEQSVL
ncbi:MAG: hypothetical protein ACI4MT_04145 [Christensenellales bacterium]